MRILLADDHEAVRSSIRSLLNSLPGLTVCAEAASGTEAIEKARSHRPDVAVLDISMPEMGGIEAARVIRREIPHLPVILVSQNDPKAFAPQVAELGCQFISKAELPRKLVQSIASLHAGGNNRKKTVPASNPLSELPPSEMTKLIQGRDWGQTPVGPPETWSPALRMFLSFMLANRMPILLWWGPDYVQFYNDAYLPIPGVKHPRSLGLPARECWTEIWHILQPLVDTPFRGGAPTWSEDFEFAINRSSFLEETHFTIAYSPVPDSTVAGGIGGVVATVHEITQKVIGERRLGLLRDLAARATEAKTGVDASRIAAETLAKYPKDVPFALIYLLDSGLQRAQLAAATGVGPGEAVSPESLDVTAAENPTGWPISSVLREKSPIVVDDLGSRFASAPAGPWSRPPRQAVIAPIPSNKENEIRGLVICGASALLPVDEDYRSFCKLLAAQLASAIANAEAYEQEWRRAEALAELDRAKTAFFSNVSHEFRTPLTLMMGPLEDAIAHAEGPLRGPLEVAHRNSLRLLKLVNTLLDFSRIEAGRAQASYEATDLARLTTGLASVFRSAIERAGMSLVIDCEPVQDAYVDREMWEKIVLNLLSNAFKFTLQGEIKVCLRQAGNCTRLIVSDTGTGIPKDEISQVFDRFHRVNGARGRSYEGSGIGLALVQELVKLHGGTVRVESEVDRGSAFIVEIPLGKTHLPPDRIGAVRAMESTSLSGKAYLQEALHWLPNSKDLPLQPNAVSQTPPSEGAVVPAPGGRILLAEDNADMRDYVRSVLSGSYEMISASDGEDALRRAREQRPDLVLTDVMMPRLDGFGLLRAIRADEQLKSLPVIMLSARAGEESRVEGLDAGADDYLVKPFSARELLARVRSHLTIAGIRREASEKDQMTNLLASIVGSSDDAVVSKDLNGVITSWNKAAERMFGYTAEEAVGRHVTLIIPTERHNEEDKILRLLRQGKRIEHFETIRQRKDGTQFDLSLTISPIRDSNGRVVGASKVARDISERKRAERQLRESEQRFRNLSETLDAEVRSRTGELENRTADVLRQSELLRDLSRRLLLAQDEERRRIARELHDSAGQTLTVLGMNLAQLMQKAWQRSPQFAPALEEIQQSVQQLHAEIRTASYLLHPPLLDESGLASALGWYVDGLAERSGLEISLDVADDFGRLPHEMELVVFRVIQECLTNIHRHSGSKTAAIRLARGPDEVTLEIQDRGKGISPEKLGEIQTRGSGVGVRGMRERLFQFNGVMKIDSGPHGTRITANIPLQQTDSSADPLPDPSVQITA